ncbi:iron-sulfur cluster insertion protein ErpA [bacterium]|nr:iron-sulfur cluster insertion protein ErpA [bacterium]MBU1983183.1 iron-sulfur cluster insertion protein ErpA [bacterium]
MIRLTETASAKVREIMQRENKKEWMLRMGVRGGGCSGFKYVLGFDNQSSDADETFAQDGITLVCDTRSYLYLNGTEIDYEDGLNGSGFVFKNPNAAKNCGCGQSFSS